MSCCGRISRVRRRRRREGGREGTGRFLVEFKIMGLFLLRARRDFFPV